MLPLNQFSRRKRRKPNTHTQKPSIINNHLQLTLAVPVAVGFGVPGAPAFLHCLKELVHKAQGGVVEEGFEVVWERGGVGLVQNLLLGMSRRMDHFHGLLWSCGGCNPGYAALQRPLGSVHLAVRSFKLRIKGAQASTRQKLGF